MFNGVRSALGDVGTHVKLRKEAEEEETVAADVISEGGGIGAFDEHELEGVDHDTDELDHLQRGEVLLPPDVLLVAGSQGGHHVIEVHDDVDEGVEQSEEGRVTAGAEADADPDAERHDAVVDDVQQRNVLVFLAQDEEERVEELGELGEVVPPGGVRHPHGHGVLRVVHRLAPEAVAVKPAALPALVEQPTAEHHLQCIHPFYPIITTLLTIQLTILLILLILYNLLYC